MRTGPFEATRFEATPSNAAVRQSLQVIEERATAAFWFVLGDNILRVLAP
jgi:hypothetical protein